VVHAGLGLHVPRLDKCSCCFTSSVFDRERNFPVHAWIVGREWMGVSYAHICRFYNGIQFRYLHVGVKYIGRNPESNAKEVTFTVSQCRSINWLCFVES
jgi:hypothetical protein